ncbi:ABC-type transporter, periplasmic subunit family 3 [Colwellia psychrerythraea]|uniref:ABC-type transporter, periplasmic subunit family 3 n=2 Tax=Colwellia psychrerythraea TaxID=28229 RepID=A0A099L215_COLPS|nr:ABC-type transporter, periplasmic subunit family 3 [Colwellia psychrerythraea]
MALFKINSPKYLSITSALCVLVLCLFCQSQQVLANEITIKAAVAEEFKDGLHSQYLNYIAKQLAMKIDITTMPLARRIQEVKKGNADIIVGLDFSEARAAQLIYIYPAYEKLSFRFFTLNDNADEIQSYADLTGKVIGVIRSAKHHAIFEQDNLLNKYELRSLDSCIKMLLHGRIDIFIHYEESTSAMLMALGVSDKITKTTYQPTHSNEHYIAISKKSPLAAKQRQLTAVIEKAIQQQDFIQMRLLYYKNKR